MLETLEQENVDLRRQQIATYIQSNLRPAEHLLEEGRLTASSEDVVAQVQGFEVREYQLDAWGALWDARQAGAKTGLIHLATGLGKTSVAVFDVIRFREEFYAANGWMPKILFASHQDQINAQAAQRFAAFIPDATQGTYNGAAKEIEAEIVFGTMQSLYSGRGKLSPFEFDYIIYDEAHHTRAETYEAVIRHFQPEFQLALTATPYRTDDLDIRELFGKELYKKSLPDAIAEGLLVDVDYHIVFDEAVKAAMESGFEPETLKALDELLDIRPRNEQIAENIREEKERIGSEKVSTIIFCDGTTRANEMAELLGGRAYHSDVPKEMRDSILADFKAGVTDTICTVDMFNEGIDIPDARLIVFLRSTQSPIVFEQQLGRGLRRAKGKERVSVLDFVANVERVARVRELSAAIRSRAIELEDGTQRQGEGDTPDMDIEHNKRNGLLIHTSHGNFDFDRLTVDLLEKWGTLKVKYSRPFEELANDELVSLALLLSPKAPLTIPQLSRLSSDKKFISGAAVIKRFGSMYEFYKACGFDITVRRGMTADEIVALALALKPDKPIGSGEMNVLSKQKQFPSAPTVISRFGSLIAFHQACGFGAQKKHMPNNTHITGSDVVSAALQMSPATPLSGKEIDRLSQQDQFPVSKSWIIKHFGTIAEFHKQCGFTPERNRKDISDQEIIDAALRIKPTGPLGLNEIIKYARQGDLPVGAGSISRRFGTISEFQRRCGFNPNVIGTNQFSKKPDH